MTYGSDPGENRVVSIEVRPERERLRFIYGNISGIYLAIISALVT